MANGRVLRSKTMFNGRTPSAGRPRLVAALVVLVGCNSDSQALPDGATASGHDAPIASGPDAPIAVGKCSGSVASVSTPGPTPPSAPALTVPGDLALETLASVGGARQLAGLPNGDLLVATGGDSVYIVPNAEAAGLAGAPVKFTTIADDPVQGITFAAATCTIYVASQHGVYAIAYADGQLTGNAGSPIAHVRTGAIVPNSDGDVHVSTSVAYSGGVVYAGVGSSCNSCVEVDGTRASIQRMDANGANMATRATRLRNAIALTVNPATGTLWAGGAGQDNLGLGHPYEFFDAVGSHPGVADYGWPACEENQQAYKTGADCSATVAPLIELPAYSTLIGATFYPSSPSGAYALPATYRGGLFITAHGSWHKNATSSAYFSAPRVVFVGMNGDTPKKAVNWSDPSAQWTEVIGGFQAANGIDRIARPTGIAVGAKGSLYIADDQNGRVYRVRPK